MFQKALIASLGCLLVLTSCQENKTSTQQKPKPLATPHPVTRVTPREGALKIAYFHGGRCHHLFRAWLNGYFEKEKVKVDFYTSFMNEQMDFAPQPKDPQYISYLRHHPSYRMGRTTGTSMVRAIEKGDIDGGCIGESSFIQLAQRGYPVLAIAQLGHNFKGKPGLAVLTRPGWKPKSIKEFKGKVISSRRAGPADELLVREMLLKHGIDPDKDATVIKQMSDDRQTKWLKKGVIDAGVYHMFGMVKHIEAGTVNYMQTIDWMDVEMLTALLVVHPRVMKERPDDLRKLVAAYAKSVADEELVAVPVKGGNQSETFWKRFGMVTRYEYKDMRLPGADYPPYFDEPKMFTMQKLLNKHFPKIKGDYDLKPLLDQRFVIEFMDKYGKTLDDIREYKKKHNGTWGDQ